MFLYGLSSLLFWVVLVMGVFALVYGSVWDGRALHQRRTATAHQPSETRLQSPDEDTFDGESGRPHQPGQDAFER
jgi:hypothetical protein